MVPLKYSIHQPHPAVRFSTSNHFTRNEFFHCEISLKSAAVKPDQCKDQELHTYSSATYKVSLKCSNNSCYFIQLSLAKYTVHSHLMFQCLAQIYSL